MDEDKEKVGQQQPEERRRGEPGLPCQVQKPQKSTISFRIDLRIGGHYGPPPGHFTEYTQTNYLYTGERSDSENFRPWL